MGTLHFLASSLIPFARVFVVNFYHRDSSGSRACYASAVVWSERYQFHSKPNRDEQTSENLKAKTEKEHAAGKWCHGWRQFTLCTMWIVNWLQRIWWTEAIYLQWLNSTLTTDELMEPNAEKKQQMGQRRNKMRARHQQQDNDSARICGPQLLVGLKSDSGIHFGVSCVWSAPVAFWYKRFSPFSISFYTIFLHFLHLLFDSHGALQSVICICAHRTSTVTVTTNGGCGDDAWISNRIKYVPGKLLACFLHAKETRSCLHRLGSWANPTAQCSMLKQRKIPFHGRVQVHGIFVSFTRLFIRKPKTTPSNGISSNAFYRLCFMFIFVYVSFFRYGVRIYLFESHLPALNSYFKCE